MKTWKILILLSLIAVLCLTFAGCFDDSTRVYHTYKFYDGNGQLIHTTSVIRFGNTTPPQNVSWTQEIANTGKTRTIFADSWVDENGNIVNFRSVTSDVNAYAKDSTLTSATVVICDYNGDVLDNITNLYVGDSLWAIEYNGIANNDLADTFKFVQWNAVVNGKTQQNVDLSTYVVTGNTQINAVCANFYDVRILNLDGTTLLEDNVQEGTPIADIIDMNNLVVDREIYPYYDEGGYIFNWVNELNTPILVIDQTMEIKPVLTLKQYSISLNADAQVMDIVLNHGDILTEENINELNQFAKDNAPNGKVLDTIDDATLNSLLTTPVKQNYNFTAQYRDIAFTVEFYDYKGDLITSTACGWEGSVEAQANAITPEIRQGYEFNEWVDFNGNTFDLTKVAANDKEVVKVFAKYDAILVNVNYVVFDYTTNMYINLSGEYNYTEYYDVVLASPRKAVPDQYAVQINAEAINTYFSGWEMSYDDATKTIVFTSKYSTQKFYYISFIYNEQLVYVSSVTFDSRAEKEAIDNGNEYHVYAVDPFTSPVSIIDPALLVNPEGMEFAYWAYTDIDGNLVEYDFNTPVTNNMTLTAVFAPIA